MLVWQPALADARLSPLSQMRLLFALVVEARVQHASLHLPLSRVNHLGGSSMLYDECVRFG